MDAKVAILKRLDMICRERNLDDVGEIQWNDGQVVRSCTIRAQRGDPGGWHSFIEHLRENPSVAWGFYRIFEELGWAAYSIEEDRHVLMNDNSVEANGFIAGATTTRYFPTEQLPKLTEADSKQLISALVPNPIPRDVEPRPRHKRREAVMYIEAKPRLTGHARIGRVHFSPSGRTLYYGGRKLQSLKGAGYKANYFDVESGLEFWISNCRKDGNDTLYPGTVEIDDDAREEYWTVIRHLPENSQLTRFRSEGKYSKRRPS